MQRIDHPLHHGSPGTARCLTTLHYGPATPAGRKAVLQASLHADEWPPLLVMFHLRRLLDSLEQAGRLRSEIVLVPFANPIGLAQRSLGAPVGRFDLGDGRNFNRGFPVLAEAAAARLRSQLDAAPDANRHRLRAVLRDLVDAQEAATETASLKRLLLRTAIDADIVLDLHCDNEAVLHAYVGTPLLPQGERLARHLGARALLHARESGDGPFDEAISRSWWEVREAFPERIAPAGFAATVELRGHAQVDHATATADAQRLLAFLADEGFIEGALPTTSNAAVECAVRPLEAVEPLCAPAAGVLVFLHDVGAVVPAGAAVAEIVDVDRGHTLPITARYGGLLYARTDLRFVHAGARIAKIAGSTSFRTGLLLSE